MIFCNIYTRVHKIGNRVIDMYYIIYIYITVNKLPKYENVVWNPMQNLTLYLCNKETLEHIPISRKTGFWWNAIHLEIQENIWWQEEKLDRNKTKMNEHTDIVVYFFHVIPVCSYFEISPSFELLHSLMECLATFLILNHEIPFAKSKLGHCNT